MVATYTDKIMHGMIFVTDVYSWKINNMFIVSQVSGLVENFEIGIFSDSINAINVKLCMVVLLIELYLFTPFQWPWLYLKVIAVSNSFYQLS